MNIYLRKNGYADCVVTERKQQEYSISQLIIAAANSYANRMKFDYLGSPPREFS